MKTAAMTCFGLVRHAPTLWNEQKRIQGQDDSPLSANGLILARVWGKQLAPFSWDRLLCSDMGRVQQTVDLMNRHLRLPVAVEPRLREQNWGRWSSLTLQEIKIHDRNLLGIQEQRGWDFHPPQGESRRTVLARSIAALTAAHASWPGENILVICHEGIIKCLLYHLLGRLFLPDEQKVVQDSHMHILAMGDDSLSLEQMNCLALTCLSDKGEKG